MINKLEMFIAVAREGHFGRAAESLGMTQPTLSTGIKQLEEMLGVQLIFRGSRYGGLTPEGQRALVWARQLVSDARTFREEMRITRHGLSGIVRLAVIPTALTWAAYSRAVHRRPSQGALHDPQPHLGRDPVDAGKSGDRRRPLLPRQRAAGPRHDRAALPRGAHRRGASRQRAGPAGQGRHGPIWRASGCAC